MNSWEQDPDAWKEEESSSWEAEDPHKPWEGSEGWKLEEGYEPGETTASRNKQVFRSLEVTLGIRPTVDVTFIEWEPSVPAQISVKNRDALKQVSQIADLQKALTEEENELFQFSAERFMWIRIPWEAVT